MSKFSDRFALAFTFPSLRDRSPGRPRVAIGPRGVRFPRLARCRAGGGGTAPSAARDQRSLRDRRRRRVLDRRPSPPAVTSVRSTHLLVARRGWLGGPDFR